jgi:UDP:flavonoid glycosyltransferase YjiC (YdhE family)
MTTPARRRVLFIAEAVTLAHVARTHALAEALDPARFDVIVAADPRYAGLFGSHRYVSHTIHTIPTQRFAAAIDRGAPIYDAATLDAYVDEDLRALEHCAPDVVVGDFRLSLGISARLARVPYATVTNAGWSPYADIRFTVPDLPMTRWLGVGIAQRLFDFARPVAFAAHARPLNRVRVRRGLPALPADIRFAYTDADFILYADLPEMFRMRAMPENHAFLGPVPWSPAGARPDWWGAIDPARPVVYVNLGSSGKSAVLPALVDALAALPVTVLVATAGRQALDTGAPNVFVADYLPGADAAARAAVVVCNGGSPACHQAFAAGVPVLGVPTNLDQYLNMAAVEGAGAGLALRPAAVGRASVARALRALLDEPVWADNTRRLQRAIAAGAGPAGLATILDRLIASRHAQPSP